MTDPTATQASRFIQQQPHCAVRLIRHADKGYFKHLFEPAHIDAINTAIACRRPLLLTGAPGVGKTQLARAVACKLERAFVRHTVDARTEARELLWQFDAVARLADAQLAQGLGWNKRECDSRLQLKNYLRPGPLWWGFDWQQARALPQAREPQSLDPGNPDNGVVVLIDEIDKAEIDVPNGLLEALGDGSFQPDGLDTRVRMGDPPPLIVITSNRERSLPDAFVRRCILLKIALPSDPDELKARLIERGQAHCGLSEEVVGLVAERFIQDLSKAKELQLRYRPGQAEFLDLLEAMEELAEFGHDAKQLLAITRPYILDKGSQI